MPKRSKIKKQLEDCIKKMPGVDRNTLAKELGRPLMSPNDIAQLEELVRSGLITVEEVPTGITKKFVYYPAAS